MSKQLQNLSFYVLFSVIFLVSVIFNFEALAFYSKPFIIPAIVLYYFLTNQVKTNYLFLFSILFFYLGDVITLIDKPSLHEIGLVCFSIPYFFVLYILVKRLKEINVYKRIDFFNFSHLLMTIILVVLMLMVLNNVELDTKFEYYIYLVFGLQLVFMGILSSVLYLNENGQSGLFLSLAVASFIISDMFYILNKNLVELSVFKFINALSQTVSYFFYSIYFIVNIKK